MKIISTAQITSDAYKIEDNIKTFCYDIDTITQIINSMSSVWKGKDADSFTKKYIEVIKDMKKYYKTFLNYCEFLKQVNGIYSALDTSYNKEINTE